MVVIDNVRYLPLSFGAKGAIYANYLCVWELEQPNQALQHIWLAATKSRNGPFIPVQI